MLVLSLFGDPKAATAAQRRWAVDRHQEPIRATAKNNQSERIQKSEY
jgi:hypothetical protein